MYAELSLPLCLVFFIWFLQMNWACFYSFIFQPVFSTSSNKHCWGCDFLHPRTSWTSFSESSFSAWLLHLSFHPPPPFFFNLSWLMIFLSRTQSEALWGKREKVVVVVRVGKDWMEEQKKKWEKRVLWENTHLAIFPVYFFPRRTRG